MVQGQTPGVPHAPGPASDPNPITPDAIREEQTRVLASHEFRASKRSQEFLRYVIEHTINGQAEILKERTIGIEVFGRAASYDPSEDATVRVKAGEVRKRLGLYYAGEGIHNPVRIELPAGTYVPEFRRSEPVSIEKHGIEVVTPPEGERYYILRRPWHMAAALALAMLAAGGAWFWVHGRTPVTALDQFWSPVLKGTAPVELCAAFVPLMGRDPNAKPALKPADDVLMTDQFVGGGDLIAISRLSALLTRRQRAYHVRIGNEISLHDLQTAPAIMVGYSLTHWKEISSELRFFINGNPIGITDNGQPTKWALPNLPRDRHTSEDYAIVSRVFHPDTHAMLVEIAGITQYGTDAASDLVTNADLFGEALRGAPPDWPRKNLQLVLHVKVISDAPSSPRVVASYFW
jgi:hypothetical protein